MEAFNKKMKDLFDPSWLTCLNESMVVFTNAYCPGWMNVKRKPHPFGNEYHTIACCQSHIIFHVEMVEGKDRPTQGPNSQIKLVEDWGATGGLVA